MDGDTKEDTGEGSWREFARYWRAAVVLAGGVLVGAVTIYVASSLLPTAVGELGGTRLYAWNTTAFLLAQVTATMLVPRALARRGTVGAYLAGFATFAAGSLLCAVSPAMAVLLAGRAVQGLGAGLLTGLGFAVLYSALPSRLWRRGSALISAMFGVGNFAGPALGGWCAQFGSWRTAFVVLAVAAVALAVLVPLALPGGERSTVDVPVPVRSPALLVAVVGLLSVAGVVSAPVATAGCLVLALALLPVFVAVDRRAAAPVLPPATYRAGAGLHWVYLTVGCLAAAVAVETFLPLFGQRLGGLPPVLAGFFGAALSFGWSACQVLSASAHRERTVRRLLPAGPALLCAGLAVLAVAQVPDASAPVVLGWLGALLLGGAGIGLAMPHLSVAAMSDVDGDGQAAAIATVLTLSTAFGAAVAGLLANLGAPGSPASARWLLGGFAVLAACGVLAARRVPLSRPAPARPR